MNKLPNGWQIKTIKEVCNIYTGNSINKQRKEKNFIGLKEGLNYIGTKDISFDNIIDYDNGVKIPFKDLKDFKVAKSNSTLLCIEGGSAGRKIGFTNQDICFGNKLCCFETIDNEPKFIFYYLQSDYFLEEFYSNIQGLIGGITKEKIRQIKIPLPPLETQKQIAERLDFLFDKIDKALQLLNENKEYIKKYRLSILKDAFDGKLTRPSKNWEIKTLNDIALFYSGYTPKKDKLNKNNIGFPYFKISDMNFEYNKKFLKTSKEFATSDRFFNKNSIVFPKNGGAIFTNKKRILGQNSVVDLNTAVLTPFLDKINLEFLFFFFHGINLGKYIRGSILPTIDMTKIKQIKIPLPPIEIQKEIVAILDKKFKSMEEIERLNNENIENLLLLKKSLLKDAFGGRL